MHFNNFRKCRQLINFQRKSCISRKAPLEKVFLRKPILVFTCSNDEMRLMVFLLDFTKSLKFIYSDVHLNFNFLTYSKAEIHMYKVCSFNFNTP